MNLKGDLLWREGPYELGREEKKGDEQRIKS
jgi:hypothetical protein